MRQISMPLCQWSLISIILLIVCLTISDVDAFRSSHFVITNSRIIARKSLGLKAIDLESVPDFITGILNIGPFPHFEQTIPIQPEVVPTLEIVDESLKFLGKDLLLFLGATIVIVPLCKFLNNTSSVLGFLFGGLLLGPAGLGVFSKLDDLEVLADFGVLFLLFEQGLELTVERLKSLSRYAFGMGSLQVLLCTVAFFVFPFIGGVQFLEYVIKSRPDVVDITRLDEAVVIGAALSLSSSAFVLKILQEKNQLASSFGSACLGVLLFQDIAVVPLLVLLPIIESNTGPLPIEVQLSILGGTFIKAIVGIGGILFIGGGIVRFLFSQIAQTKSSETFVALCLLVAVGTGALTDAIGLSSTLGAFAAGTLLAESNYRNQIESDIKPFRGLLLGLFFLTTGATVDITEIQNNLPTVIALLGGLIAFKAIIITGLAKLFGLSRGDSFRTGLVLSGGGEFAFVVLNLADKLHVLPDQLAKLLVGVVVISMALTPLLSGIGDQLGKQLDNEDNRQLLEKEILLKNSGITKSNTNSYNSTGSNVLGRMDAVPSVSRAGLAHGHGVGDSDVIVICGFGNTGELVMKTVDFALTLSIPQLQDTKCIAFSIDPSLVIKGYKNELNILYGDGSQPAVLATAGIVSSKIKAFIIAYRDCEMCIKAVERLRYEFPKVPIISRSSDTKFYSKIIEAGATACVSDEKEASIEISMRMLASLGIPVSVSSLSDDMRELDNRMDKEFDNSYGIINTNLKNWG